MLTVTEQVKCRGLSGLPNHTRVAAKPCNMKRVIGITKISVNHNSSAALERSVIHNWGLKPVLQVPNLTLSFCSGSQHLVSRSVLVVNL